MDIFKGIISPQVVSNFKNIAESEDEKIIADKIYDCIIKYRTRLISVLIFTLFWRAVNLLVLYYSSQFSNLGLRVRVLVISVLLIFVSLGTFWFEFKLFIATNKIKRIVGNLFDKLLELIIDRFRLSLAERIPNFPDTKSLVKSIEESFFALVGLTRFYSTFGGSILGVLIITLISLLQGNNPPYALLLLIFLMILFFRLQMFFSRAFHSKTKKSIEAVDRIESKLRDTKPLITQTKLDLQKTKYFSITDEVIETTSKINITHSFIDDFIPLIFYMFPVLMGWDLIVPIVAASIIINYLSSSYNITNTYKLSSSHDRLIEIETLLESIKKCTDELTKKKYNEISKKVCNSIYSENDYRNCSNVYIKDLVYKVGREGMVAEIEVPDMKIPNSKISRVL